MSADLDWFFSVGTCAFERSVAGSVLERAKLYWVPQGRVQPEITARPTGKRELSQAVEPDQGVMARHGDISRRLARVPIRQREALARWFGDEGAHWSSHPRGRAVALFPLTEHGRELIARERRAAKGAALELSDRDRLKVAMVLDATQGGRNDIRRRLVELASREAFALYAEAEAAWAATE